VKKADPASEVVMSAPPPMATNPQKTLTVHVPDGGVIEVELTGGRRVRLSGSVDLMALNRLIAFLEGR
jgi:hypothetical protein